jgi:DNA-directed RNA polymerase subunit RPC12/RpoP
MLHGCLHAARDKRGRSHMVSISTLHHETCPRCGSRLVSLEWDERVNAQEVQDLWHCWTCKNEFVTTVISSQEETSVSEITAPFFTSLVTE